MAEIYASKDSTKGQQTRLYLTITLGLDHELIDEALFYSKSQPQNIKRGLPKTWTTGLEIEIKPETAVQKIRFTKYSETRKKPETNTKNPETSTKNPETFK